MNLNWKRMFISLLLAMLFVSACAAPGNGANPEPTSTQPPGVIETATAQSPSTETPSTTENSLCDNPYYPVRQGATWTYKSTGSPAGEFSFTDTITSARSDGFTLTSQFGDLTRTQEWACEDIGLVALQLGGAPAVTLTAQGVQLDLQINNVSGVTFPKEIIAGNQWQHNLDFEGQVEMAGQSGNAQGTAVTRFTAIGSESVTVPAGTFEAMKIQVEPTLDINVGSNCYPFRSQLKAHIPIGLCGISAG